MKCLVFLALVAFVFAHDKMNTPGPRVATESTVAPCGASNGAIDPTPSAGYYPGDTVPIAWDGNHIGGTVYVSLVPQTATPTTSDINANLLANGVPYKTADGSPRTTITIPLDATPGVKTLTWEWRSGGSWWSCADVTILRTPPVGAVLQSGTIFTLKNGHGTFDSATGMLVCDSGYKATHNGMNCVSGNGEAFGIAFAVIAGIALIAIVATVVFIKLRKPESYGKLTGWFKGESSV